MSEIELILTKLKIVSEEKENGMYLCDKKHSKILLDYIQQKENIIKEVRDNLENSIKSINEKLKNNKEPFEVIDGRIQYINGYRVVRLKAFRTKCKELLEILDKVEE